ncbi:hypothetical protein [Brevundimonas sp. GCM10030266]|uniref:hypothetical protein n=1 Tax=Brevundimonas sp. GCM10030266 TaxID=3273386 RepID=UPI003619A40D
MSRGAIKTLPGERSRFPGPTGLLCASSHWSAGQGAGFRLIDPAGCFLIAGARTETTSVTDCFMVMTIRSSKPSVLRSRRGIIVLMVSIIALFAIIYVGIGATAFLRTANQGERPIPSGPGVEQQQSDRSPGAGAGASASASRQVTGSR